jgi:inhibitor of KinA sporulation pathway (predicted exonuclease)
MKYLIIVDLEATSWERGFKNFNEMEIIEIGAVKIDISSGELISQFDEFVRPINNPVLSEFCRNLTTIEQNQVDSAESFPIVWKRFTEWIGDYERSIIASWGNYDKWQFNLDCRRNGMVYIFDKRHLNIKDVCRKRFKRKKFGMASGLKMAGLEFEGTPHRGLDDARNAWRVFEIVADGNLKEIIENYFIKQADLFE